MNNHMNVKRKGRLNITLISGIMIFVLMCFISSSFYVHAEGVAVIADVAPPWVPADSSYFAVLNLKIDNNSQGSDWENTLNWINITFTVVSGSFDPTIDIGEVRVYNESDSFDVNDVQNVTNSTWFGASPIWNVNITGINFTLPSNATTSTPYNTTYVVINTTSLIPNGATFNVSIGTNMINTTYGNTSTSTYWSSDITADTIAPTVEAGSNEVKKALFWTESAANRTTPASALDATSGIDNYTWEYSGPGSITFSDEWALNTSVSAGTDGVYKLWLNVTDNASNTNSDWFDLTWDTTPPTSSCTVSGNYWDNDGIVQVDWLASDNVYLNSIELWYRYRIDNTSAWGAWTNIGTTYNAVAVGTSDSGTWNVNLTALNGEGLYKFATNTTDAANNWEGDPTGPGDDDAGYESSVP